MGFSIKSLAPASIDAIRNLEFAEIIMIGISDVFLCMSEHEGFCIPLVESMYFEIPIVAYNSSAIPDTLGETGILVNHKKYAEIAMILDMITTNDSLSKTIANKQKERLKYSQEYGR